VNHAEQRVHLHDVGLLVILTARKGIDGDSLRREMFGEFEDVDIHAARFLALLRGKRAGMERNHGNTAHSHTQHSPDSTR
jgi:hypothetical protein